MSASPLITPAYRAQQARLHQENAGYGVASVQFAPLVGRVIDELKISELLDYGAGKGRLGQALPAHCKRMPTLFHYDPAIEAWSAPPRPTEMVACIDVLEHIEPDCLEAVLDDLRRLTLKAALLTIHTGAAAKVLSDGRNAHLIQKPAAWWLPLLMRRFDLINFVRLPAGFWALVEPLPR